MIPKAKEWTIIFSNMSVAWGSFGYDEKEDALRVTVTPKPSEAFEERLSYRFDNPTEKAVTLALRWEKLMVPIAIEVDTPSVVMASMRAQLRGPAQFNWVGWNQAARYWVKNGGDLKEAAQLADRSISMNENFQNLSTRALIAEKQGDAKAGTELRAKAMPKATEGDLNQYGYELLGEKKIDDAIAVFQKNAQAHPSSWNVYDSLAETYLTKGDKTAAAENYGKALALVKDPGNKKRIEQTLARLKSK
jgi:tetratricopeptide (TPR) repeat protein